MSRRRALQLAIAAVCGILVLHLIYSFCAGGEQWLRALLIGFGIFVLPPLVPAIVSMATANPLRAVGAVLFLAPWMLLAIYVDCIAPYTGGGASMIYVVVQFWGTPSAILGALITGPILRWCGVTIVAREPARCRISEARPTTSGRR
ncbi:hypothetical protein LYSHEL_20320 [Lysobacter helvus]|uniref:Uncharacterized protein n=2 Tax=Lysobacteraceae TaxID=32033 RepID=A0ABN6FU92_9GAMM|nr:hypothetical protein LYSCAS_20330 [Lysobacter caseinilyticus]BCT96161.1 hypothetical protein LYSHEL_20320 [Lysobacter helvus]